MDGVPVAVAVVVSITVAAAVVIFFFLVVAGRAIKAAHARPLETTASVTRPDMAHSHDGSRTQGKFQGAVLGVVSGVIQLMIRLGIRLGPLMMLTVRGRKTGVPRVNPVDLFERDGRNWVVATHDANASWVRNLRAAGEGELALGRRRWTFTAVELPQDRAGAVLKEVLGPRLARPVAGFVLRQTLAVTPDAPLEDFIAAAAVHPVFEVSLSPAVEPLGRVQA